MLQSLRTGLNWFYDARHANQQIFSVVPLKHSFIVGIKNGIEIISQGSTGSLEAAITKSALHSVAKEDPRFLNFVGELQ
jgi:hypothetical protein